MAWKLKSENTLKKKRVNKHRIGPAGNEGHDFSQCPGDHVPGCRGKGLGKDPPGQSDVSSACNTCRCVRRVSRKAMTSLARTVLPLATCCCSICLATKIKQSVGDDQIFRCRAASWSTGSWSPLSGGSTWPDTRHNNRFLCLVEVAHALQSKCLCKAPRGR